MYLILTTNSRFMSPWMKSAGKSCWISKIELVLGDLAQHLQLSHSRKVNKALQQLPPADFPKWVAFVGFNRL